MAIYRLLVDGAFDDRAVRALATAYEGALQDLKLVDRNDPFTEIIAHKIIELARMGERDPVKLRELAVKAVGGP
jgi:hypothetical protein